MNRITFPMLMLALSLAPIPCWAAEPNDQPKASAELEKLCLSVRLCKGNPDGSQKAGTRQILMEPNVVMRVDEPCHFMAGGELGIAGQTVPYGEIVDARVHRMNDGRLQLTFTIECSNVAQSSPKDDPEGTVAAFHIEKTCGIVALKPGVLSKVHCSGGEDQQTWLELRIEETTARHSPTDPKQRPRSN